MKKGDLYYLTTFPKTKVLITKNYNKRKFHDDDSHFNAFPSISIVPCIDVIVVAGEHYGAKETYVQAEFKHYFKKIELENESR